MARSSRSRTLLAAVTWAALGAPVAGSGCGDDFVQAQPEPATSTTTAGVSCNPGAMVPCTCNDGSPGLQLCLSSGAELGACQCTASTTTIMPTTTTTSGATTAGSDSTGSSTATAATGSSGTAGTAGVTR